MNDEDVIDVIDVCIKPKLNDTTWEATSTHTITSNKVFPPYEYSLVAQYGPVSVHQSTGEIEIEDGVELSQASREFWNASGGYVRDLQKELSELKAKNKQLVEQLAKKELFGEK